MCEGATWQACPGRGSHRLLCGEWWGGEAGGWDACQGAAGVALGETVVARNPATAHSTRPPSCCPDWAVKRGGAWAPEGPQSRFPCGHGLPFSVLLSSSCANNRWAPGLHELQANRGERPSSQMPLKQGVKQWVPTWGPSKGKLQAKEQVSVGHSRNEWRKGLTAGPRAGEVGGPGC